jgi:predicted ATPase
MLTSLGLSNFKAWKSIRKMRLAPITGLFGTNSSGKSSILQFLLMLKQTADSADRGLVLHLGDDKSPVSLGTFSDLVTKHDASEGMNIDVEWRVEKPISIKDPDQRRASLFESDELSFTADIDCNGTGKLVVQSLRYGLGTASFTVSRKEGKNEYALSASAGGFKFKRHQQRAWPLPAPVKFYGFPDEVRAYFQNAGFLSTLELALEKMLHNVYYLGPLRDSPRREYAWAGGDPADMGRRGENAIAAMLAARERGLKISRGKGKPKLTLEEYVAFWLKELGLISEFRVEEISQGTNLYRAWVRRGPDAPEVLITDVGFGVSQVLPVLVLSYYAPEGSTILLEQPEIHLHPTVQLRLADVFIDAMNVRKIQFIIESHSEHLLRRFQRRIAEGATIQREQTALYFCDMDGSGSMLTPLDVDLYGSIKNWPRDFFGNEMEDIAAMSQAALSRRKIAEE